MTARRPAEPLLVSWRLSLRVLPWAAAITVVPCTLLVLAGFWWILAAAIVLPALLLLVVYVLLTTTAHALARVILPADRRGGIVPETSALSLGLPCLLLSCASSLSGPLLTNAGWAVRGSWAEGPASLAGQLVDLAAEHWFWLVLVCAGPLVAVVPALLLPYRRRLAGGQLPPRA